jgi:hypothetical protein
MSNQAMDRSDALQKERRIRKILLRSLRTYQILSATYRYALRKTCRMIADLPQTELSIYTSRGINELLSVCHLFAAPLE